MKERYIAIVQTHSSTTLVEGEKMTEIEEGVGQALEQPRIAYPNYDFDKDIVLIRGEKIEWEGGQHG